MTSFRQLSIKIYKKLTDYGIYTMGPPIGTGIYFYSIRDRESFFVCLGDGDIKINDNPINIGLREDLIDTVVKHIVEKNI
jgi:hypothetical protein